MIQSSDFISEVIENQTFYLLVLNVDATLLSELYVVMYNFYRPASNQCSL